MLYKIKTFVTPSVLRSLCYSLFNSHLAYGLVVWDSANKTDLDKIKNLQKKAIYAISDRSEDTSINHLLSNLKILNIDDLFKLQLSSLMWDYDHDIITSSLKGLFKRSNSVHKYGTREATRGNLYYSKVNTTKCGINSLTYQGIQILNNLQDLSIYKDAQIKSKFLKTFKLNLISEYVN